MRNYDPRLARFLNVDPLAKNFPWRTPYQFAGNTPINTIDLDGAEVPSSKNKNAVEGGSIDQAQVFKDANGALYRPGKSGDDLASWRYVNNDIVTQYLGGVLQPKYVAQALNFADAVDGEAYQSSSDKKNYGPLFENGKDVMVRLSSHSAIVTKTIELVESINNTRLSNEEENSLVSKLREIQFVFQPDHDHSSYFAVRMGGMQLAQGPIALPMPASPVVLPAFAPSQGAITAQTGNVVVNVEAISGQLGGIFATGMLQMAEHKKNARPSNWNKHTKTRSGETYRIARNSNRGDKNKNLKKRQILIKKVNEQRS